MALSRVDFDFIKLFLLERTAILLEDDKDYFVDVRLGALAKREGLKDVHELLRHVRAHPDRYAERVINAMIVNETSFFRDHHAFESLRLDLLPRLIERRSSTNRLRIWCAACSSGQEPYTVAMTLREYFPELRSWDLHILATDISPEMVARTRQGKFSQLEINKGLPASLLVKYFERNGLEWTARPELSQLLDCRVLNLAGEWSIHEQFDLILVRNVLMYFTPATKQMVLGRVRQRLAPDGYLLLGSAETPLTLGPSLNYIRLDRACAYSPTPRTLDRHRAGAPPPNRCCRIDPTSINRRPGRLRYRRGPPCRP